MYPAGRIHEHARAAYELGQESLEKGHHLMLVRFELDEAEDGAPGDEDGGSGGGDGDGGVQYASRVWQEGANNKEVPFEARPAQRIPFNTYKGMLAIPLKRTRECLQSL